MIQTLLYQRIGQANFISLRLKNPKRSLVLSNGSLISKKDDAELPHDQEDSEDHEMLGYPGSKAKNGQGFSREKEIFRASIMNNTLFLVFTTIHWRHTITILAFRLEKKKMLILSEHETLVSRYLFSLCRRIVSKKKDPSIQMCRSLHIIAQISFTTLFEVNSGENKKQNAIWS